MVFYDDNILLYEKHFNNLFNVYFMTWSLKNFLFCLLKLLGKILVVVPYGGYRCSLIWIDRWPAVWHIKHNTERHINMPLYARWLCAQCNSGQITMSMWENLFVHGKHLTHLPWRFNNNKTNKTEILTYGACKQ